MLETLSGIVTFTKDLHPLKAPNPIFVTLFGIVTFDIAVHLTKANRQMLVTPLSINTVFICDSTPDQGFITPYPFSTSISPVPLIVSVCMVLSYDHVTCSPQVPLVGVSSANAKQVRHARSASVANTHKSRFMFFICFSSLSFFFYFIVAKSPPLFNRIATNGPYTE